VDDEEARAIALLEATHKFPVEYDISVIAVQAEGVLDEVRAAVAGDSGPLPQGPHQTVPSRGGKYASHRFRVPCQAPQDVLALYVRVRRVKGVITVL
jgi:putative lipoic acid-binding regulatory protein